MVKVPSMRSYWRLVNIRQLMRRNMENASNSFSCQSCVARLGHEEIENSERCRRHPREE